MKILKQGKLPDKPIDTVHTVMCEVCNSKIEFNISEIIHENCSYWIICPFCKVNVWMFQFEKVYDLYRSRLYLYKSTRPKG